MMMFTTAATAISALILVGIGIPPLEAFARPSFTLCRSSSTSILVNHHVASRSCLPLRGGDGSHARSSSSIAMGSTDTDTTAANEIIVTIPTSPIEGMRPGTSGLRKKVEVWMGQHYVENFIQSLIDTAADANGGKMLDT
jgi:hypothetical protein